MYKLPLFHLAFPVYNLDQTKDFYTKVLDCKIGRKSNKWIDFNFYGHQITAHLTKNVNIENKINNEVDGKNVPIRHFGLIMDWRDWHNIKDKLIFNDGSGTPYTVTLPNGALSSIVPDSTKRAIMMNMIPPTNIQGTSFNYLDIE